MRLIIYLFFIINTNVLALIYNEGQQEALTFFWNGNNSILNIEQHNYMRDLLQKVDKNDADIFIIKDKNINAFATKYQLIGINSGLITATANESELASVVAHEISHINLKHFDRMEQKNKNNYYLLLGGVILGAISNNTDTTEAIITSTIAGTYQKQINWTREYEIEADNNAEKILKNSNFDVGAMSGFFEKLQKNDNTLEFLSSHPLSVNRMVNSFTTRAHKNHIDSFNYLITKAKLNYRNNNNFIYENQNVKDYMAAYIAFEKQDYSATIRILQQPTHLSEKILLGRAFARLKKLQQSIKYLSNGDKVSQYYLAESYFLNANFKHAISILRKQNYKSPSIYNYKLLSKIYLKNQQNDYFHLSNAEALLLSGANKLALIQLKLALRNTQNQDLADILNFKISQLTI